MRGVLQRQSLAEVGSGSKQQVWAPEVPLPSGRTSLSEGQLSYCMAHAQFHVGILCITSDSSPAFPKEN